MTNFILNYGPLVGTICLIIFYIIQIAKTVKIKSVEGVSMGGWAMLNVALLFMFLNSLMVFVKFHTYGALVEETANIVLALVELALIFKYRKVAK